MHGSPLPTRFAFALLAAFVVSRSAHASCAFQATFGQLTPSCGSSYCYVVTPGAGTAQSMDGAFWAFGYGSPVNGMGTDDGISTLDSWLPMADGGRYLQGDWTATGVDGCITGLVPPGKPSEIMVADIEDSGVQGGLFAVAAARRFLGSYPEFDFTFTAGGGQAQNITLVDIPRAQVVQSTRTEFVFGSPDFASVSGGVATDGSVSASELVVGYRLFRLLGGNGLTSYRKSDGWKPVTGIIPFGENATVPWNGQTPLYYAYGLVFESGLETAYVGHQVTVFGLCNVPIDEDGDGSPSRLNDSDCCPDPATCDCDDHDPTVHPGAHELCNGIDDNCDGFVDSLPPGFAPSLRFASRTHALWYSDSGAQSYDTVSGDLTFLRASGGNFAVSTIRCVSDDRADGSFDDAEAPSPNQGYWYLVRAADCLGQGSYDHEAGQVGTRDFGIAASGQGCP